MHFRTGKKQSNDIYLGDALDVDKDGNPLTVEDTISSPIDLAEDLEKNDTMGKSITHYRKNCQTAEKRKSSY